MRRRLFALVVTLAIAAVIILSFAPVVHSSMNFTFCNLLNGCHQVQFVAYESPTCAIFGFGAGMGVSVNYSIAMGGPDQPNPLGYHFGCPSIPSGWTFLS